MSSSHQLCFVRFLNSHHHLLCNLSISHRLVFCSGPSTCHPFHSHLKLSTKQERRVAKRTNWDSKHDKGDPTARGQLLKHNPQKRLPQILEPNHQLSPAPR